MLIMAYFLVTTSALTTETNSEIGGTPVVEILQLLDSVDSDLATTRNGKNASFRVVEAQCRQETALILAEITKGKNAVTSQEAVMEQLHESFKLVGAAIQKLGDSYALDLARETKVRQHLAAARARFERASADLVAARLSHKRSVSGLDSALSTVATIAGSMKSAYVSQAGGSSPATAIVAAAAATAQTRVASLNQTAQPATTLLEIDGALPPPRGSQGQAASSALYDMVRAMETKFAAERSAQVVAQKAVEADHQRLVSALEAPLSKLHEQAKGLAIASNSSKAALTAKQAELAQLRKDNEQSVADISAARRTLAEAEVRLQKLAARCDDAAAKFKTTDANLRAEMDDSAAIRMMLMSKMEQVKAKVASQVKA